MDQRKLFPPGRTESRAETPPSRVETGRHGSNGFSVRLGNVLYILVGAIIACGAFLVYDSATPPPQHLTETDIENAIDRALDSRQAGPSMASVIYATIQPSLVSIQSERPAGGGIVERCSGTGFVIDEEGTIVTCCHIVNRTSKVKLRFASGFETTGTMERLQSASDIALVRPDVAPPNTVPALLGADDSLKIGDEVFAAGDPLGMAQSLTAGVVSGLGRSCVSKESGVTLTDLIQFDAAVNPGNSGGPLVNHDGRVVGIVTTILNPTDKDFFVGIGLATPVEKVMGLLQNMLPAGQALPGP